MKVLAVEGDPAENVQVMLKDQEDERFTLVSLADITTSSSLTDSPSAQSEE